MANLARERTAVLISAIISFLLVAGAVVFFLCSTVIAPGALYESWQLNQYAGLEALKQREYAKAESMFRSALAPAKKSQNNERIAETLDELGNALFLQSKKSEAATAYMEALAAYTLAEKADDRSNPQTRRTIGIRKILILLRLSEISEMDGFADQAMKRVEEAITIRKDHNVPLDTVDKVYRRKAALLRKQGHAEEAEKIEADLNE